MSKRANDLANAFNKAVEAQSQADEHDAAQRAGSQADLARARAERAARATALKDAVISEIQSFADQIDALRVERTDAGLVLSCDSNVVSLDTRSEEATIAVMGTGVRGDRLDPDVDGTWMLTLAGSTRPLWNYGIQQLLVDVLGLPRPAQPVPDPGPPKIRRAPRIQSSIAPPRPAVRRED